jgi:hypothetical protein
MDHLIAALALAGSIVGAILSKLLASEVEAWLRTLAHRSIERAVRRLPEHERERRLEEWLADNNDYQSNVGRLLHAIGCLWASRSTVFTVRTLPPKARIPSALLLPGNHDLSDTSFSAPGYLSLEQLFDRSLGEIEPSDDIQSIKNRMRPFVHPDIPLDDPNWDDFAAAVKALSEAIRRGN